MTGGLSALDGEEGIWGVEYVALWSFLDRMAEKQEMRPFFCSLPLQFLHWRRAARNAPSTTSPTPPQHARSSAFHRDLGFGKAEAARENP